MACAALVDQQFQPEYARLLNEPLPPSIRNLQHVIEDAWAHGNIIALSINRAWSFESD